MTKVLCDILTAQFSRTNPLKTSSSRLSEIIRVILFNVFLANITQEAF